MEETAEDYTCAVCLDLLYKPTVNPCGHAFCFWCAHKSMHLGTHSSCPYCRHKIRRLPAVCEALHNHIRHLFPEEYERRAAVVTTEETSQGYGSFPVDDLEFSSKQEFYKSLLSCATCGKVGARPLVLSCGHLICSQACCQPSCGKCHLLSGGLPCKCPKLNELVSRTIPELVDCVEPRADSGAAEPSDDGRTAELGENLIELVHLGVGCDGCGEMPIRGRRFQCQDCPAIGFDLCSKCYDHSRTQTTSRNRFNQEHGPDHRMQEIIPPAPYRIFSLVRPHNHEQGGDQAEQYFILRERDPMAEGLPEAGEQPEEAEVGGLTVADLQAIDEDDLYPTDDPDVVNARAARLMEALGISPSTSEAEDSNSGDSQARGSDVDEDEAGVGPEEGGPEDEVSAGETGEEGEDDFSAQLLACRDDEAYEEAWALVMSRAAGEGDEHLHMEGEDLMEDDAQTEAFESAWEEGAAS